MLISLAFHHELSSRVASYGLFDNRWGEVFVDVQQMLGLGKWPDGFGAILIESLPAALIAEAA